jgi:RNA binding exosome subunit
MVGVEPMGSWEGTKVTNSAGNLIQQIQEQIQNLAQQIQEQTLKSARGFYGDSLGSLKGQLEYDRSQLQVLLDQLPESQPGRRQSSWAWTS